MLAEELRRIPLDSYTKQCKVTWILTSCTKETVAEGDWSGQRFPELDIEATRYDKGCHLANIVTYTIAKLVHGFEQAWGAGRQIGSVAIWTDRTIPDSVDMALQIGQLSTCLTAMTESERYRGQEESWESIERAKVTLSADFQRDRSIRSSGSPPRMKPARSRKLIAGIERNCE